MSCMHDYLTQCFCNCPNCSRAEMQMEEDLDDEREESECEEWEAEE